MKSRVYKGAYCGLQNTLVCKFLATIDCFGDKMAFERF